MVTNWNSSATVIISTSSLLLYSGYWCSRPIGSLGKHIILSWCGGPPCISFLLNALLRLLANTLLYGNGLLSAPKSGIIEITWRDCALRRTIAVPSRHPPLLTNPAFCAIHARCLWQRVFACWTHPQTQEPPYTAANFSAICAVYGGFIVFRPIFLFFRKIRKYSYIFIKVYL